MSNVGNTRKLFLDSRFKIAGNDADFTLELPQDVQCTRTSSFFVASCSFANSYGAITELNNKLYLLKIYPGLQGLNIFYIRTIPTGAYTPTSFAPALQTALNQDALSHCTVTWNDTTSNYDIEFAQAVSYTHLTLPTNREV